MHNDFQLATGGLQHISCKRFCIDGVVVRFLKWRGHIPLELRKRGYDEQLALGSLATAGTLGLLVPPSIVMVLYAVAADASIIRVFLAGFMPGMI